MQVACPNCQAAYNVDDRRIPAGGLNARCPKCQKIFPVRKPAPPAAFVGAVPLPAPSPGGAPPTETGLGEPPEPIVSAPGPVDERPPAATLASSAVPLPPPATTPASSAVPLPPPAPIAASSAVPLPPPARETAHSRPAAVPLPPPDEEPFPVPFDTPAAPPVPEPLGFGEVSFDSPAGVAEHHEPGIAPAPGPSPAAIPIADPLSVPPPADPFSASTEPAPVPAPVPDFGSGTGVSAPPAFGGGEPGRSGGLGAIGPAETEELEALFGEGSEPAKSAPASQAAKSAAASQPAKREPAPAPAAAAGARYKVRRRSGKIFGPFEEAQVIEMLGKGELLGNEDISGDGGATWNAVGAVPAFAEAMHHLMDEPPAAAEPGARSDAAPTPYVSRMAASKVAEEEPPARQLLRRLVPFAAAAAALLLVLGVGLGAGRTRYGIFFHKVLRGRGGPNRPGASLLVEARSGLAHDGYAGARRSLDLADRALKLDSGDTEAQGVYVQAAAWLARRGGGDATVARARALAQDLAAHDPKEPDSVKARVALGLATSSEPLADLLPALEKLAQKSPRDGDALWLLGEAAAARKDWKEAARWYGALEADRPAEARATHGLAAVAAARGDAAAAKDLYRKALSKDRKHLSSAVELAALSEKAGDAAGAEGALREALAPEASADLSPVERSRARVLAAGLLVRRSGASESQFRDAERVFEEAVAEDPSYSPSRLAYARFLVRRGALDRAAQVLQPVAQAAPDPELAALYARVLVGSGRVIDALNVIDGAFIRWPTSSRLLLVKGLVAEQGGKRDEARSLYERAAGADSSDWEPHFALGRVALRAGELERAEAELKLAAERGPQEPEPQVGFGDWKLARRDAAGAEASYRRALALDPHNAGGHMGLGRVFVARGDDAAARPEVEKALQLDPRLVEAQVLLGEIRWRGKDLAGAKKAFQAAVALQPQGAVARTRLGSVELELGEVDAALNDLLAASNLDLALADGHFWLGRALLAKGETKQAVDQLRRACELRPDSPAYHLHLGMAQERANSFAEAADEYKLVIAKDPSSADGYERLGQLYAAGQNRCAEAVEQFEKALKVAPSAQRIRVALGDCKHKLGKYSEAIALYRQVLKAAPSQPGLYYRIGRAVHESTSSRQALPWYERASREEPSNPMPHYYLGFSYKERGQKAKAIQEFRAYLRARPDAEDRKDVEREIEDLGG